MMGGMTALAAKTQAQDGSQGSSLSFVLRQGPAEVGLKSSRIPPLVRLFQASFLNIKNPRHSKNVNGRTDELSERRLD